jgi:hypothetical protein
MNSGNDIYDMDHAYCRLIFKVFEGIEVWEAELPVAARTGRGSYTCNQTISIEYIPGYREFGKSRYIEAWVTQIKGWPSSWAQDNVKACQKVGKLFKKSTGYHLRHIIEAPKMS